MKTEESVKPAKGKAAKKKAATGKPKAAAKGKAKGKKKDDEMDSDDSLNDFIVGDDEDIEFNKKRGAKTRH